MGYRWVPALGLCVPNYLNRSMASYPLALLPLSSLSSLSCLCSDCSQERPGIPDQTWYSIHRSTLEIRLNHAMPTMRSHPNIQIQALLYLREVCREVRPSLPVDQQLCGFEEPLLLSLVFAYYRSISYSWNSPYCSLIWCVLWTNWENALGVLPLK